MKKNSFYLIGIPIILLVISFKLVDKSDDKVTDYDFNTYLNPLPTKYINLIQNNKDVDSSFFHAIIDNKSNRELVVFKLLPSIDELKTNFVLKLFPTKNKLPKRIKTPLTFTIVNNAEVYNYKGRTYGVFKKEIPFINLDKVFIRPFLNEKEKNWKRTIDKPFEYIENIKFVQNKNSNNKSFPNPYSLLFEKLLSDYNISHLPYSFKVIKDSLFQVNNGINHYFTNNNQTIGRFKNSDLFWELVNDKPQTLVDKIAFNGKDSIKAKKHFDLFTNGDITLYEAFDLKKIAYLFALDNLFNNNCNDELYFLFNTINNKLEPVFINSTCLGQVSDYVRASRIIDAKFINQYIQALKAVSELNISEELIEMDEFFFNQQSLINTYYPENVFNIDILNINQRIIKKSLNPSTAIKPEVISVTNKKMMLSVLNMSNYPIIINELNHLTKKSIVYLRSKKQILSRKKDTIEITLPRSFENLFVSKKKKNAGFSLYKHISELYLGYSISGLKQTHFSSIIPYQEKEHIEKDLFRNKTATNNHKNILVDEKNEIITFTEDSIVISSPLIIPKGYVFSVKQGTTIDIIDGGKIISYAPLNYIGTKQKPIKVFSSDKKGQGILVLSDGKQSNLEHVVFDQLTNLKHGYWSVSGALTFYESPVSLNHVTVSNNSCEDALNIVRTTFEMKNCTISNTQSDAFDGDFVTGIISFSKFQNLGNDAIDVSGSDLKIINIQISNAGDKGLSAGENSTMFVNNTTISKSEIGVAGKDLSTVTVENLKIMNTKLGFTAFQKKSEFGPSHIIVNKLEMKGVELDYLVENSSSLIIEGIKMETSQNVKDRMYGVEFGVSSKETRKNK